MQVKFDKYSLIINGKRETIRSGAFHYFRCPGEDLWIDRLSKLKAAGYNAVDLYFCWNFHSEEEGKYDFSGMRDVNRLLEITKELGLFVMARPGPYINAEVSAGGLPHWLFKKKDLILRNRKNGDYIYSESYMNALKDWYSQVIPIINKFDNVIAFQIENEYSTNGAEPDYMQELYDIAREMGVKVPIFHNDAYCAGLYADIVDVYGCDIYPYITPEQDWKKDTFIYDTLDNLEDHVKPLKPDAPLYIAEMQAGWFDKYFSAGYEHIINHLGDENINIVTKTALSQGVTMFNHYMACGGTSWGNIACDEVYTSYDFSAPLSENGLPKGSYFKAKEANYFLKSFDISSTEFEMGTQELLEEPKENIFARLRKNIENDSKWLFVKNMTKEIEQIKLKDCPLVTLKPFDMKILPIGLELKACNIDFSSLELFVSVQNEQYEVVFALLDDNSSIEFSGFESFDSNEIKIEKTSNVIKIKSESVKNLDSIKLFVGDKTTEVVFLDKKTSDKTWLVDNKVIIGPDVVADIPAKAFFKNKSELRVLDLNESSNWKISEVEVAHDIDLPKLSTWKKFPCSPEINPDYKYYNWTKIVGNMDAASNEVYDEFIWYKGSFDGQIKEMEVNAKHCWAIYINGELVYEHDSYCYDNLTETEEEISFKLEDVNFKGRNDITVLVQNLGFDKGFSNDVNLPRGIIDLVTVPIKPIEWYIRGNLTPELDNWKNISNEEIKSEFEDYHLTCFNASFDLDKTQGLYAPLYLSIENADFDKAVIFLNGKKIGRFWQKASKQHLFYLPESFLQKNNIISVIPWFKNCKNQQIKDYHFGKNNVIINIGNFGPFFKVDMD